MSDESIDILMITYNRPHYTRRSLGRLLETCDESMRVWVWHNGDDPETLEVVKSLSSHPRVHRFRHSSENLRLREPTNWFWTESRGDYVCKVDDDCLLPDGWGRTLRAAHEAKPTLGVIGCWRFLESDYDPELTAGRIMDIGSGHRMLRNFWVDDSGFLMKRACIEQQGLLRDGEWFDGSYCIRLSLAGWLIGWYFPFIMQDHMDDPRSPNSGIRTDADVLKTLPLTAQRNGIRTVLDWDALLRRTARGLQSASLDPLHYTGWRLTLRKAVGRARRMIGIKTQW